MKDPISIPVQFIGTLVIEEGGDHREILASLKKGPNHEKHGEDKSSPPLSSAEVAHRLGLEALKNIRLGPIWRKDGPDDRGRLCGALLLQKKVVGRLHFDPLGNILPKGFRFDGKPDKKSAGDDCSRLVPILEPKISLLEAANGMDTDKKRGLWKLPLIIGPFIVAELFISPDGKNGEEDAGAVKEIENL
jgi:hypothetical protein